MNKKGMSQIMLTLIISTIGIASIFLGVYLAYTQFASDMGISYNIPNSLSSQPNYPSKIVITNVYSEEFDTSDCSTLFSSDFCNSLGLEADLTYVYYRVEFKYTGNPSFVSLLVTEKQGGAVEEKQVVMTSTGYIVHYDTSANIRFVAVKNEDEECSDTNDIFSLSSDDSISKLYYLDANGKEVEGPYKESHDYCMTKIEKDIDVGVCSVGVSDDGSNLKFTVDTSFTGNDLKVIKPSAILDIYMHDKDGSYQKVSSTTFDSKKPGWEDSSYPYRILFDMSKVTAEEPGPIKSDKRVVNLSVKLDKLGDVFTEDMCNDVEVVKDDGTSSVIIPRDITGISLDADGNCKEVNISILSDINKNNKFYVYIGGTTTPSTISDDADYRYEIVLLGNKDISAIPQCGRSWLEPSYDDPNCVMPTVFEGYPGTSYNAVNIMYNDNTKTDKLYTAITGRAHVVIGKYFDHNVTFEGVPYEMNADTANVVINYGIVSNASIVFWNGTAYDDILHIYPNLLGNLGYNAKDFSLLGDISECDNGGNCRDDGCVFNDEDNICYDPCNIDKGTGTIDFVVYCMFEKTHYNDSCKCVDDSSVTNPPPSYPEGIGIMLELNFYNYNDGDNVPLIKMIGVTYWDYNLTYTIPQGTVESIYDGYDCTNPKLIELTLPPCTCSDGNTCPAGSTCSDGNTCPDTSCYVEDASTDYFYYAKVSIDSPFFDEYSWAKGNNYQSGTSNYYYIAPAEGG